MIGRKQAWTVAIVASLTMAVSYADRQALAVLAPTVTKQLAISETAYGWLLSAFSFAYMVGAPLAGRWIDHVGARLGLTIAVLVWSAVAGLHALVPGLVGLLVLRILLGLAEAPSFPGAAQTVQRVLAPPDRPRGFGVLFIGSSIGAMLVPPLAGWLEHVGGFRLAFVGTALVGLCWLPAWFWVSRPAEVQIAMARPAGEAAVHPGVWRLLMLPAVQRGLLVVLAASPMMSYALNWSSKYLAAVFGSSQQDIGRLLWLPALLYDLGTLGFGHLASRQLGRSGLAGPPPRALLASALACALAVALLPMTATPWQAVLLVGLAMAGGGGLFALTTADMLARVPQGAVSATSGLAAAAQSIAYIVASPLIGWGVTRVQHHGVVGALALWLLPGCLIWIFWVPPKRVL